MTGPQDEPFPFDDDGDGRDGCWSSPPEMRVGRWVEIPVDDEGPQAWMRIEVLLPPRWTHEHRWAVRVRRDGQSRWIKVAPWLRFRTADHDPTRRPPPGIRACGAG